MKKRFLTAMVFILALSMSMTAVLSGCGCDSKTETSADEATQPTSVVTETQIATDEQGNTHIEEATKADDKKSASEPDKKEAEKSTSTKPDSKKNDKKNSSAENGSPSGKTNNNHSSNSNSSSSVTSSNNTSSKNDSTSDKQNNASSNKNDGKTWHEAIYKTISHPAQTKKVWVVDAPAREEPIYEEYSVYICNDCSKILGDTLDDTALQHLENHLLNGEKGSYHTGINKVQVGTSTIPEQGHYETKVIKEAWTEKVLVKEAGYY